MYLHELSPEQRSAFLVLARDVIRADERLTLEEVERLDDLYAESGMGAEVADAPNAAGDLNLLFPTPRQRAVVLIELLLLAHADRHFHPREERAIYEIAARLQVDQGLWTNLLDWASRYSALRDEARAFGRESGDRDD
ncbi:MAG: hypothetical protein AAFQ43_03035 [Bacteroidota bacterium]